MKVALILMNMAFRILNGSVLRDSQSKSEIPHIDFVECDVSSCGQRLLFLYVLFFYECYLNLIHIELQREKNPCISKIPL